MRLFKGREPNIQRAAQDRDICVELTQMLNDRGNLAISYLLDNMNKNSLGYLLQEFSDQIRKFGFYFSAMGSCERITNNKEQVLIWSYIDYPDYFQDNRPYKGKTRCRNISDQDGTSLQGRPITCFHYRYRSKQTSVVEITIHLMEET